MSHLQMTARQIMTTPVVTVTPQTPVQDAVRLMLEHHISGLPVIGESGELVGIVTEADLLLKEAEPKPVQPVMDWFGRSLWLERLLSRSWKVEGRTVQISVERGVFVLRGLVASPGRRSALLRRLWKVDGVVAIDDRELKDVYRETVGTWD